MSQHETTVGHPGHAATSFILCECPAPGCRTLTLGGTCVSHDAKLIRDFPRGRPFVRN